MKNKAYILFLASLFSLVSCGEPTTAKFKLVDLGSSVDIHTMIQSKYFVNKTFEDITIDIYYAKEEKLTRKTDLSAPEAINIKWSVSTDKGSLSSYKVTISEKEDLSDAYTLTTSKTSAKFYNAKVNTKYYYQVSSGKFKSDIGSFTTIDKGPRNIYVDGVRNVRDLGGYGYIKQGLIYRGGSFESMNESTKKLELNITSKGQKTLVEQLKIKTEIDVRKNLEEKGIKENCGLTKSTVDGLNYIDLPMYYGGNNILTYQDDNYDNPNRIKEFFSLLSERNNYPVYFHCTHGKDRTGGLAYVLEALMGADKESMYRDYLFSNFASYMDYNMNVNGIEGNFGKTLEEYLSEDTSLSLAERTYSYLINEVGVTKATLDEVMNILKA